MHAGAIIYLRTWLFSLNYNGHNQLMNSHTNKSGKRHLQGSTVSNWTQTYASIIIIMVLYSIDTIKEGIGNASAHMIFTV